MPPRNNAISIEQFQRILEVSRLLAVTTELDALLKQIAHAATDLLDCERASIFVHDRATGELCTTVALQSEVIRVPSTSGIVGHVFTGNRVLHVPRPYEDPRFNPEPDRRSGFVTRNLLSAPMSDFNHKPLGVIQAINNRGEGFDANCEAIIQLLADQAGVALQRYRLQQDAMEATYLRSEMRLAQRVQEELIPRESPQIEGLQVIGWTKAASVTGGDAYDIWPSSDGRLGVFLGDASGHGFGAAMIIAQTRALVRAMSDLNASSREIMCRVNARLSDDLPPGSFVTAFAALIGGDGMVEWSAAGHGPMLWRRDGRAAFEMLEPPAPPLGLSDELESDTPGPLKLGSGGMLVVMSDGIFEARDPNLEMYGVDRVVTMLDSVRDQPLERQLEVVRQELIKWQGKEEPADDQTLVIVRRM